MNTSEKYLKQIRYKKAKCCANCHYYRTPNGEAHKVKYCWLHDNPIKSDSICKNFKKK